MFAQQLKQKDRFKYEFNLSRYPLLAATARVIEHQVIEGPQQPKQKDKLKYKFNLSKHSLLIATAREIKHYAKSNAMSNRASKAIKIVEGKMSAMKTILQ